MSSVDEYGVFAMHCCVWRRESAIGEPRSTLFASGHCELREARESGAWDCAVGGFMMCVCAFACEWRIFDLIRASHLS